SGRHSGPNGPNPVTQPLPQNSFIEKVFSSFAAESIICFTCQNQLSNWNCLGTTNCSQREKRCVTLGMVSGAGNDSRVLITKACARKCPSEKDYPEKALSSLFCCDCSWCNILPPR
ncbi:LY6E: Lymphocyte antigen 6E, partial [Crotalus adamanteus]